MRCCAQSIHPLIVPDPGVLCSHVSPPAADSPAAFNQLFIKWGSPHFYRSWTGGVTCNMIRVVCDQHSRVVSLNLDSTLIKAPLFSIQGSFPSELLSLTSLTSLSLRNNAINSTLPATLSRLALLVHLDLSLNLMTGGMSPGLVSTTPGSGSSSQPASSFPALASLDLSGNLLTRDLPHQISLLQGLTYFNVSDNQISGAVPVQISCLGSLNIFDAGNNMLSGSVPSQYSSLHLLVDLQLPSNKLGGTLPVQLSVLSTLSVMDVSGNSISGYLPSAYLVNLGACMFHCDNTAMCGSVDGFKNLTSVGTKMGSGSYSGESALPARDVYAHRRLLACSSKLSCTMITLCVLVVSV